MPVRLPGPDRDAPATVTAATGAESGDAGATPAVEPVGRDCTAPEFDVLAVTEAACDGTDPEFAAVVRLCGLVSVLPADTPVKVLDDREDPDPEGAAIGGEAPIDRLTGDGPPAVTLTDGPGPVEALTDGPDPVDIETLTAEPFPDGAATVTPDPRTGELVPECVETEIGAVPVPADT